MSSLTINIKPQIKHPKKILVEMDANKFERLAASLGFFSDAFLRSLNRAEKDYQHKRVKKVKSLRELKK